MSAITTVMLEFLSPNDLLLVSAPLYGGTDHFINHFLPKIGVESHEDLIYDLQQALAAV